MEGSISSLHVGATRVKGFLMLDCIEIKTANIGIDYIDQVLIIWKIRLNTEVND